MQARKDSFIKQTGGFTLIELIVAMALLAILMSASAGAVASYGRQAALQRNRESARTVYNAAQAALTHARANGTLDELSSRGGAQERPENVPVAVSSNPAIQYIKQDKTSASVLLRGLLRPYILDETVYNASICVEADFAQGVVTAVCYSDTAPQFTYEAAAEGVDISDRSEEAQRREGFGCYGGADAATAPAGTSEAEIAKLRLLDGTLQVVPAWTIQGDIQRFGYRIWLYRDGKEPEEERLLAELALNQEGGVLPLAEEEYGGAELTDVAVRLYQGGAFQEVRRDFHAYLSETEDGSAFNLVLDDPALQASLPLQEPWYAKAQLSGDGYEDGTVKASNLSRTVSES